MELPGKVALITGSKRIGAVVATELARKGADVAVVYRSSRPEAERAVETAQGFGRRATAMRADLAKPEDCQRIVDDTVNTFGRLDILVNMASSYRTKPLEALTVDDWDGQLAVDPSRAPSP